MSSHPGFDTSKFPGVKIMSHLKSGTNLEWCGFYLEAPSHSNAGWMTQRATLVGQGWGIAPIYVGQQVVGPGSHIVTAAQGKIDGADAAAKMKAAGFPAGAVCFLDLENGPPLLVDPLRSLDQHKYVAAWGAALKAGGFAQGVYCSFLMAADVLAILPQARLWVFHVPSTTTHTLPGATFPAPDPSKSGVAQATVWQREMAALISIPGGGRLLVDLDTSSVPDPSR